MAGKQLDEGAEGRPENYYAWLAFCTVGLVSTLTLYGILLEYTTSGGRHLHEVSFVFVTTSIYCLTAFTAREFFQERKTDISKYHMLTLSCTSALSTLTSVRSLRYVIYPVQVLFKSCKPVPVMAFGVVLGKKYPLRKYVNVIVITSGVALFMGGGSSTSKKEVWDTETSTLMGGVLLTLSLCFDGATGAYEDKLMSVNNVEPFDLMFNIQLGKSFLSFVTLVVTNNLDEFVRTLHTGGFMLLALGLTGALGQVFIFLTISKFGALNCALIGLVRKILSLVLSFLLYGHTINGIQTIGLVFAVGAMVANFIEKGSKKSGPKQDQIEEGQEEEEEEFGALLKDTDEMEGVGEESEISDSFDGLEIDVDRITPTSKGAIPITPIRSRTKDSSLEMSGLSRTGDSQSALDIEVSIDRVTPSKS